MNSRRVGSPLSQASTSALSPASKSRLSRSFMMQVSSLVSLLLQSLRFLRRSGKPLLVSVETRLEARIVDDFPVHDASRHASLLNIEHRLHVGSAIAGKALIGPAQGMWGQYDVVELENGIIRRRGLGFKYVESSTCNPPLGKNLGERFLIDDGAARRINEV